MSFLITLGMSGGGVLQWLSCGRATAGVVAVRRLYMLET